MDLLSLTGLLLGLIAILGGNAIDGGHLSALSNLPAALIVIGEAVAAIRLDICEPLAPEINQSEKFITREQGLAA